MWQSRGRNANSILCHLIPSPATAGKLPLYWATRYPFPTLLPNPSSHFSLKLIATTLGSQWLFSISTTQFASQAKVAHAKAQLSTQAYSTDLHQQNCYIFLPNGTQQFSPSPSEGISFCYKAIHHPERWPLQKLKFPSIYFQLSAVPACSRGTMIYRSPEPAEQLSSLDVPAENAALQLLLCCQRLLPKGMQA